MARRNQPLPIACWPKFATPLPAALRCAAERALGLPLGHVRIEAGTPARRITESLGAKACAVDGRVLVHPALAPAPDTPAGQILLLHEIAHVAQQASSPGSRPASDARAAEAEAHRAAAALAAGRFFRCAATLPAREPACWDEPGHYYTVYLLMLAAGFEDLMAYRIAVYCQLPDQTIELDAAVAGTILARDKDFSTFVATNLPISALVSKTVANADRSTLTNLKTLRAIQSGLHCFTGRPGGTETSIRCKIIDELTPRADNLVEYGLALHALGDSYAHRNRYNDMCSIPYGHATSPSADEIGPASASIYREYCNTLYERLTGAAKRLQVKPRATLDNVYIKTAFDTLTRELRDKKEQTAHLANAATYIGQSMREFRPNQDNLSPIRDLPPIANVVVGEYAYSRALACARKWAHPP